MTTITGNTYPVRESLKAIGARWNRAARGWDVPDDRADEARAIVHGAGSTRRPEARRLYGSTYTRLNSGAELYRNTRGRCEDAPCCGCCNY